MGFRVRGFFSEVIEIGYSITMAEGPIIDGLPQFLSELNGDPFLANHCTVLTEQGTAYRALDALVPEVQTEASIYVRVECPMHRAHIILNELTKLCVHTFGED